MSIIKHFFALSYFILKAKQNGNHTIPNKTRKEYSLSPYVINTMRNVYF